MMRTIDYCLCAGAALALAACTKGTDDTPFQMSDTDTDSGGDTENGSDTQEPDDDDDEEAGPCSLGGAGPVELSGNPDEMSDEVIRIVIVGGETVACGDDFIAVAGGNELEIDGTCNGMAAVGDDALALVVGSSLHVFGLDGDNLEELDDADVGDFARDVASDGENIVVVTSDTLPAFTFDGSSLEDEGSLADVSNARAIASAGSGWIVAERDGTVKMLDSGGDEQASYAESTTPMRVISDGEWALVLRGGMGVDVFDVESGLEFVATYPMAGTAIDGAVGDDIALVATGAGIERLELGGELELSGRVRRPDFGEFDGDWIRAVAMDGDNGAAGIGRELHELEIGGDQGPVLEIERATTSVFSEPGAAEVIVVFRNAGNDDLVISNFDISSGPLEISSIDGPEENECDDQLVVEAGAAVLVTLAGDVDSGTELQEITFESNDQGARNTTLNVETNRDTPEDGDELERFRFLNLDGDLIDSDSLRGEVLFLKMFAPS